MLLSLSFCLSGLLSQDASALNAFWYGIEAKASLTPNFNYTNSTNTWPWVLSPEISTGATSRYLAFKFGGSGTPPHQTFRAGQTFTYSINLSSNLSVYGNRSLANFSFGGLTSRESNLVIEDQLFIQDTGNHGYCSVTLGSTDTIANCGSNNFSLYTNNLVFVHYVKGQFTVPNNWDGYIYFSDRTFTYSGAATINLDYTILQPILTVYETGDEQINNSIQEQTQQQEQYHDETQQTFDDAQDTADTDSDSSSQQATSSGTTLLAGFTSFVSALTGASASNCVINADLGNMDLGSIDLCQLSPPPAFQAISSIMVIGFTVPLSIALAKKMISLFRSFQT